MSSFRSRWGSWTPPTGPDRTDTTDEREGSVSSVGSGPGDAQSDRGPCDLSVLASEAARLSPVVRLSLRETADVEADIGLLRNIRAVIEEYEDRDGYRGGNRVEVTVITLDGEQRRLRWHSYACRELRLGIARLIARDAVERRRREGGR